MFEFYLMKTQEIILDQGVFLNEKLCKEKISEREVRYNVNKNNVCLITLSIPSRIILA